MARLFPELARAVREQAFNSILKYNFKSTLQFHKQSPRVFAKNDETGFGVTTLPSNDRPVDTPGYSNEIWSTYEYTLAASLFKYGQTIDALTLLKAGASRYDGRLRTGYVGDWGDFIQYYNAENQINTINVKYGVVEITKLTLDNLLGYEPGTVDILLNAVPVTDAQISCNSDFSKVEITVGKIDVTKNNNLEITIK